MKITLYKFRKRENKRYNYTPRFYKGKEDDRPFEFQSTFTKYRERPNDIDFGAQWKVDRANSRNRKNRHFSRLTLYIAAVLIFIFLWIIDFDLSIFTIQFDPFK